MVRAFCPHCWQDCLDPMEHGTLRSVVCGPHLSALRGGTWESKWLLWVWGSGSHGRRFRGPGKGGPRGNRPQGLSHRCGMGGKDPPEMGCVRGRADTLGPSDLWPLPAKLGGLRQEPPVYLFPANYLGTFFLGGECQGRWHSVWCLAGHTLGCSLLRCSWECSGPEAPHSTSRHVL